MKNREVYKIARLERLARLEREDKYLLYNRYEIKKKDFYKILVVFSTFALSAIIFRIGMLTNFSEHLGRANFIVIASGLFLLLFAMFRSCFMNVVNAEEKLVAQTRKQKTGLVIISALSYFATVYLSGAIFSFNVLIFVYMVCGVLVFSTLDMIDFKNFQKSENEKKKLVELRPKKPEQISNIFMP